MALGSAPFRYVGYDVDPDVGRLTCRYELDGRPFTETFDLGPGGAWGDAAHAAARLVFLLAGVSYYKARPAAVLDLGPHPLRPAEATFLRDYYVHGLGEFAHRNGVDLSGLRVEATRADLEPAPVEPSPDPLVPFGGGLDSLVTIDLLRGAGRDLSLFVMSRKGHRFAAIEQAAAATGLAVARAERELDPSILRSAELGFLNGHVPITGLLSAVAVLRAVLDGRSTVVMSNEHSASSGNLVGPAGIEVNHQWSKGLGFEAAFRGVLADALPGVEWFSLLRARSELWIAERFAGLAAFHGVFHSCNRAFHLDPGRRQVAWCGRCDKCCFIDLVLAPYLEPAELRAVFDGHEPLDDPSLAPQFEVLLELGAGPKPFECVGDVEECRAALVLAADRPDRAGQALLTRLVDALGPERVGAARASVGALLAPMGPDHVPDGYRVAAGVG